MSLLLLFNQSAISPPDPPTGVDDSLSSYDVALTFTLPPGATATLRRNGTIVATNVVSSSYTFTGVSDDDILSVRSVNAGGESADVSVVVHPPGGVFPTTAEIADKILGRNLAGGSDGGRTVRDSLRTARNRVAFDTPAAGQFTVYSEDDLTVAWIGGYSRGSNTLGPLTNIAPATS